MDFSAIWKDNTDEMNLKIGNVNVDNWHHYSLIYEHKSSAV